MAEVINIYPSNSFKVVADNAASEITCGIIIGFNAYGDLEVYGGGMLDGRQPTAKDWLWMAEDFKHKLMAGDYIPVEE